MPHTPYHPASLPRPSCTTSTHTYKCCIFTCTSLNYSPFLSRLNRHKSDLYAVEPLGSQCSLYAYTHTHRYWCTFDNNNKASSNLNDDTNTKMWISSITLCHNCQQQSNSDNHNNHNNNNSNCINAHILHIKYTNDRPQWPTVRAPKRWSNTNNNRTRFTKPTHVAHASLDNSCAFMACSIWSWGIAAWSCHSVQIVLPSNNNMLMECRVVVGIEMHWSASRSVELR